MRGIMSSGSTTTRPRIDAAAWNALLETQDAPTPFMRHEYLLALQRSRSAVPGTGWAPTWSDDRAQRRAARRMRAVPEGALLRRVRVRLGLGRRLPAPWPGLLPQAARRRAVHAGAGVAPAGAWTTPRATCCVRAVLALARQQGLSSAHLLFLADADRTACERAGWMLRDGVQFHWQNREPGSLRRLRRLPGQPAAREAQEDRAGAAPRGRRRRQLQRTARRHADRRRGLGLLLPLLHPHLPRPPLDALPHARLLRRDGAHDGGSTG